MDQNPWIIIGNKSSPLLEKMNENTHEWTCYVRPVDEGINNIFF